MHTCRGLFLAQIVHFHLAASIASRSKAFTTSMAGRKPVWFKELFGFVETMSFSQNRAHFALDDEGYLLCETAERAEAKRMFVGAFDAISVLELRSRLSGLASGGAVDNGGLRFTNLPTPVGVQALISDPQNAGAVFQAASQFNCLEMVGPGVSPAQGIAIYKNDPTQGPKCALECPAATAFRNYLLNDGRQIDCLDGVGKVVGNQDNRFWTMQNGYALPSSGGSINELGRLLEREPDMRKAAYEALRVGVHWSTSVRPPSTHRVAQVFASALPLAYAKSTRVSQWTPFATLVLGAAYDATLLAAHCLAVERGERVKVFLTCLGGGAFGNPERWIANAIRDALEAHRDAPLDVVLVHYGTIVPSVWARLEEDLSH